MNITIITDCKDPNVSGRQLARVQALFGTTASLVGVSSDLTGIGNLEAAGNLIDVLDGYGDEEAVVLVNAAPRNKVGGGKKWKNGTPFGYFRYKNVLIVATVDGTTLSLIKKFGLAEKVVVLDIPDAIDQMIAKGALNPELKDHIVNTQFRSYDFVPRAAHFLFEGNELTGEELSITEVEDVPVAIWWTDCFGNCKTTLTKKDLDAVTLRAPFNELKYYDRLKDVPDGEPALITGSSGIGEDRFLEIVLQGKTASGHFNLSSGDLLV